MKKILANLPKGNRILLLGTGGGSDIFSCLLVAKMLSRYNPNIKIDLGGMLSPAAVHTYNHRYVENPVTQFWNDTVITRNLEDKNNTEISFIDNVLPRAIESMGLGGIVDLKIHLSCKYGTERLTYALRDWCNLHQYDYILGVDVGGDILLKRDSKTVLSPVMDWTCLYVMKNQKIPSFVLEFGYGLDGESEGSILSNVGKNVYNNFTKDILGIDDPEGWEKDLASFGKMFNTVMKPVRSGHTIPLFIEKCGLNLNMIGSKTFSFNIPHTYKYRLGGKTIITDSFVRLGVHHPREAFLIDVKHLPNKTREYSSPCQLVTELKMRNPYAASELDGHVQKLASGGAYIDADKRRLSHRISESERIRFEFEAMKLLGTEYEVVNTSNGMFSVNGEVRSCVLGNRWT